MDIEFSLPISERILVNGDEGTHPIIAHLKLINVKRGKKHGLVKWNFDKWILNQEGEVVAYYLAKGDAAKVKTPQDLENEIKALIKAAETKKK